MTQPTMIKYLFCDLDGTLIRRRNRDTSGINKYNERAIEQLQKSGVRLALCTARSLYFLPKLTGKDYHFDGIMLSGGEIYCNRKLVKSHYINRDLMIRFLNDFPELLPMVRVLHCDQHAFFHCKEGIAYQRFSPLETECCDVVSTKFVDLLHYYHPADIGLFNILFPNSEMTDSYLKRFLNSEYTKQLNFALPNPDCIDVTSVHANKGLAIDTYLAEIGEPNAAFAVIGDSGNDIPMMKKTPYSFCMNSGVKSALEHSNYHVDNVAECVRLILAHNKNQHTLNRDGGII